MSNNINSSACIVGFNNKEDLIRFSKYKIDEIKNYNNDDTPKEITIKLLESGNYEFMIRFE